MPKKLYIFDKNSLYDRMQSRGRFSSEKDVVTLPTESRKDLIVKLNELIKKREVFDRVLFQTHGGHGAIWFDMPIGPWGWVSLADEVNFKALFPGRTKIYFDGCVVAAGDEGTDFLIKAGQSMLKAGGGWTLGWTGSGFAMPGFVPLWGGHTVRLTTSGLKTIYFMPGGLAMPPSVGPPIDGSLAAPSSGGVFGDEGPHVKPNIGNKI
jgi:hypothetical protein